jgi:malonate transporter and related proteins
VAVGFMACGLLVYGVAASLLRWRWGQGWVDTGYGALAAAWPNWGYMGFGLLPAVFGEPALTIMISAGIIDLLMLMPFALLVASRGRSSSGMSVLAAGLKGVARNPLFLAIAAGLAMSLLGLSTPKALDEFLRLLGSSAGPVALFAIGVFVYRAEPVRPDAGSWLLIALKLVVHPLLMWLVTSTILGLPAVTVSVMTVIAALPAAGTAFLLVERNGGNVDRVASAILMSTAFSFLTITLLIAWLR